MCDSGEVQATPASVSNGIVEAINPAVQLASSLSTHSMHQQLQPMAPEGQQQPGGAGEFVSAQELELENQWLREKLKEVTVDRDRLLCEVANLRLELDMAELKRLPEHSFPQKIDRPAQIYSTHHHHPSGGSVASAGNNGLAGGSLCGSVGGSGSSASYVYVHQQPQHPHQQQLSAHQQHYVSPQQLTYHLHSATGGGSTGNNGYHHHGSHQNIATPTLHKKGSIRSNGDVLKRTRVQNA